MSPIVQNYRDLEAWQKANDFVVEIYRATANFPPHEQSEGLASNLQRVAVTIPANIAEGQARQQVDEFRQSLYAALSSLNEIHTQLVIAERLGYLTATRASELNHQLVMVQELVSALIATLGYDE